MTTCVSLVAVALMVATMLPSSAAQVTCHDPFILIGNYSCLHVPPEKKMNWVDARHFCQNLPQSRYTDLAILDDCSQLSYIWNYLAYSLHMKVHYWIGGSDVGHEGIWRWVRNNDLVTMGVPFWYPGQPDGSNAENHLTISNTGYLADGADNELYNFICQAFPDE
ncbi:perlucin-like protein isoform X2 [Panulirus ornatus]|uniref:perlucin-like protein isoform X2 n=1 Tax=Panulirus ornatus TaxID=150431 RepID=UPI003A8C4B94